MSAFNLSTEKVAKAIADVTHMDWEPNGTRAEGYSIMVSGKDYDFGLDNVKVERLRLRLNTLDRMFNPEHQPLAMWTLRNRQGGIELRFIHLGDPAYRYREMEKVRLYDDSDGEPHDGIMTFASYLFYVAYTAGIGHSKTDHAYEGDDAVTDLANDFVYDTTNEQYIFDGQQLYDYIFLRACDGAVKALNQAVKDYRKHCADNGLKFEKIIAEEERQKDETE